MAFLSQKTALSGVQFLRSWYKVCRSLPPLDHRLEGIRQSSLSKEWMSGIQGFAQSRDRGDALKPFNLGSQVIHNIYAIPQVPLSLLPGAPSVWVPLLGNVDFTASAKASIRSIPFMIAIDNPKDNTLTILIRGTDFTRLSEFLISIGVGGRFAEFNNNDTVRMEDIIKVGLGTPPITGRGKSSFWGGTMNSTITVKDNNGNVIQTVPSGWQSMVDFVASFPKGRQIQIITHSVGAAFGTALNLAIASDPNIKPQSVKTLNLGGLNTLDSEGVAAYERLCAKHETWNLTCTTDAVARLSNIMAAFSVSSLSEQVWSDSVKASLDNYPFKAPGKTMCFDMNFGFGAVTPGAPHGMPTYEAAVTGDNYNLLRLIGTASKGACTILNQEDLEALRLDLFMQKMGIKDSTQW